jgi:hypothetical protein
LFQEFSFSIFRRVYHFGMCKKSNCISNHVLSESRTRRLDWNLWRDLLLWDLKLLRLQWWGFGWNCRWRLHQFQKKRQFKITKKLLLELVVKESLKKIFQYWFVQNNTVLLMFGQPHLKWNSWRWRFIGNERVTAFSVRLCVFNWKRVSQKYRGGFFCSLIFCSNAAKYFGTNRKGIRRQ